MWTQQSSSLGQSGKTLKVTPPEFPVGALGPKLQPHGRSAPFSVPASLVVISGERRPVHAGLHSEFVSKTPDLKQCGRQRGGDGASETGWDEIRRVERALTRCQSNLSLKGFFSRGIDPQERHVG